MALGHVSSEGIAHHPYSQGKKDVTGEGSPPKGTQHHNKAHHSKVKWHKSMYDKRGMAHHPLANKRRTIPIITRHSTSTQSKMAWALLAHHLTGAYNQPQPRNSTITQGKMVYGHI